MPEVTGVEKLFSLWARKKALRFNQYGTTMHGYSWYGDEDYYFPRPGKFPILISGIYQVASVAGVTKNYREPYYITKNPRTELQQTNRSKMADAVLAYQALTSEQKKVYYKNAIGKRLSGYNLFLREYLLSH